MGQGGKGRRFFGWGVLSASLGSSSPHSEPGAGEWGTHHPAPESSCPAPTARVGGSAPARAQQPLLPPPPPGREGKGWAWAVPRVVSVPWLQGQGIKCLWQLFPVPLIFGSCSPVPLHGIPGGVSDRHILGTPAGVDAPGLPSLHLLFNNRWFFLIIYLQFSRDKNEIRVIFYTYKAQKEKTKGFFLGGRGMGGICWGGGDRKRMREKGRKEKNLATIHQHSWDRNSSAPQHTALAPEGCSRAKGMQRNHQNN